MEGCNLGAHIDEGPSKEGPTKWSNPIVVENHKLDPRSLDENLKPILLNLR